MGLVATEGISETFRDKTLYLTPFAVDSQVVGPIRRRAVQLALNEIRSGDLRRGVAGALFARSALHYPPGQCGRKVEQAERRSWDADFINTIDSLREVVCSTDLDPVVCVSILEAVHWHADYGDGPTQDAARAVVYAIPDKVACDLTLLLRDGWGHLVRERGRPVDEHQRMVDQRHEQISMRALAELDDSAVVVRLEERLEHEVTAFERDTVGSSRLLTALVRQRPSLALEVIDAVRRHRNLD